MRLVGLALRRVSAVGTAAGRVRVKTQSLLLWPLLGFKIRLLEINGILSEFLGRLEGSPFMLVISSPVLLHKVKADYLHALDKIYSRKFLILSTIFVFSLLYEIP